MEQEQEKGKREQIIEATMRILVKKGFHHSKIEEIAQEAQVGKGTVYEYFSSKKELFQQVVIHNLDHYSQLMKTLGQTQGTAQEKLILLVGERIIFTQENKEMVQIFHQDHSWMGDQLNQYLINLWKENNRVIEDILQQGIAAGELVDMPTAMVATALQGMMDGISAPIVLTNTEMEPRETAERVVHFILTGLKR